MLFIKRLREGVRRGEITCSVRIWMRPHVTVGRRYPMDEGEIEVDSILPITLADVTPEIARASGFRGVVDLLRVAKHGRGENVYLVRFHYVPQGQAHRPGRRRPGPRRRHGAGAHAVRRTPGASRRRRNGPRTAALRRRSGSAPNGVPRRSRARRDAKRPKGKTKKARAST